MTHEMMFGAAQWLAADEKSAAPNIRASFHMPAFTRARIIICGLGYFQLYLNGKKVSDDLFVPVTSDYVKRPITQNGLPFDEEMHHRCYCLEYDIASYLQEGKNELGVALGSGFFHQLMGGFDYRVVFGQMRLCYRIEWEDAQGNHGEILSGPDARWHDSIVTEYNFFRGEKQDLNQCPADWMTAPYDTWQPVEILPPMETEYQLQDCPADTIIRQLTPRLIKSTPQARLYDAGENISGWVVLEDESKKGEEIHVLVSEDLNECGHLHPRYQHQQHLDVISDGNRRLLHLQHTWHGFRYFTVEGKAKVHSVAVIHSNVPVASSFASSSPVLNWLYQAFIRTQLSNMHGGIPSDCPHLERKGYTGDGQLLCETVLRTLNHKEFLRKWMRDILDCQDIHSGHVQYVAPYSRCGGGPGGWGCAIITVPWQYYRQYGDPAPLAEMYDGMCHYLEYMENHSENHLVVSDRPGEWCLGDWCPPGGENPNRVAPRLPEPFVNTYFLIKCLSLIQQIEKTLGKAVNPLWEERKNAAVSALNNAYFDAESGNYCGGVEGANAFALDIGLGNEKTLPAMIAHYEKLGGYDTGIFGTEIVTRVLFEQGESALAFQLLTSENDASFADWMKFGATTLWEYWNGGYQRSLSHPMFGAVTKELFHYVLGIRQENESCGWKKAVIAPTLIHELPYAHGHIETPLGKVCVSYQAWEDQLKMEIDIPAGMDAVLSLQGKIIPLNAGFQKIIL